MMVLFDFDGTVADSFPVFLKCMNNLSREFGFDAVEDSPEVRRRGMHRTILEVMRIPENRMVLFSDRVRDEIRTRFGEIPIFPAVRSVILRIASRHRVGILSVNSEEVIRNSLEKGGLEVDLLLGDISLPQKGVALQKVLGRERGGSASETIYVGDEIRDVLACRMAGIPIVAVTWGFEPRAELESADPNYVIDDPAELLTIVKNRG